MKAFGAGAFLLLASCNAARVSLSDPVPPGLTVVLHEESYAITASTAEDLADAIQRFGPEVEGERVAGSTAQNITWDYQVAQSGTECRIHAIEVLLTITTTLPEWANPSAAPSALREQWNTFAAAVRRHEDEHKRISLEGAHDVLKKLKSISPGPCARLTLEARTRGQASLRRYAELNREFDRDTRGGRTQGVVWPPGKSVTP
jgi:predicted secreted Zn-dependent protease